MIENIHRNFRISEDEVLDLTIVKDRFKALLWICDPESHFNLDSYIVQFISGRNFTDILQEERCRIIITNSINEFFHIVCGDLKSLDKNLFHKYFIEYEGDSEIVKKIYANRLIKGLKEYKEYCWDKGAHLVDFDIRKGKGDNDFYNDQLVDLYFSLYQVWKNAQTISNFIKMNYSHLLDFENRQAKSNNAKTVNPFPKIFKTRDAYSSFKKYLSHFESASISDISYAFRKLSTEEFIHNVSHKQFINFLDVDKSVSNQLIDKLRVDVYFRRLEECRTEKRKLIFNICFNI